MKYATTPITNKNIATSCAMPYYMQVAGNINTSTASYNDMTSTKIVKDAV